MQGVAHQSHHGSHSAENVSSMPVAAKSTILQLRVQDIHHHTPTHTHQHCGTSEGAVQRRTATSKRPAICSAAACIYEPWLTPGNVVVRRQRAGPLHPKKLQAFHGCIPVVFAPMNLRALQCCLVCNGPHEAWRRLVERSNECGADGPYACGIVDVVMG
jgi:hypothetical protein